MNPVTLSPESQTFLRGVAITAVVLIHYFSELSYIYLRPTLGNYFIFFDQLARFSVPLFIILSGFSLSKKYLHTELNLWLFFKRRVLKLLPLYVLWSVFSFCVFHWIPVWGNDATTPANFFMSLILGRIDYQLYFLPLIFQLYVLFPFIFRIFTRTPARTLVCSALIQAALFFFFSRNPHTDATTYFYTDQAQYQLSFSWIGYFVGGMWLATYGFPVAIKRVLPLLALGGLAYATYAAQHAIRSGLDPLFALTFTRFTILLWIVPSVLTLMLFTQSRYWHHLPSVVQTVMSWLGKHSYLIFLSHTLALRILFESVKNQISAVALTGVVLSWCICMWLSLRIKE